MPTPVCKVSGCNGCPMRDAYPNNTFVEPKHGTRPTLLIIGEAPGREEAERGEPFVGGAGRLLRGSRPESSIGSGGLLGLAGILESDVTILNTIQCRPPDNVYPADPKATYLDEPRRMQAVHHCLRTYVQPQIAIRPWRAIVALGAWAFRALVDTDLKITEARGFRFDCRYKSGTPVYPTIHPAALMRQQSEIPSVVNDLAKAARCEPYEENLNTRPSVGDVLALANSPVIAVDIETGVDGAITHIGLSAKPHEGLVVPATKTYLEVVKRVLHSTRALVGHNLIHFDLPHLQRAGLTRNYEEYWDTMLMHHLRHPDLPHSLEYAVSTYLDVPPWKQAMQEDIELYCARDVCRTMGLFRKLWGALRTTRGSSFNRRLDMRTLLDLYKDASLPLAFLCQQMSDVGLYADPLAMDVMRKELLRRRDELAAQLPPELAPVMHEIRRRMPSSKPGKKFELVPDTEIVAPYRSPKSLARYLYDRLGLPAQRNLSTGRTSVDRVALMHLRSLVKDADQKKLLDVLEEIRSIETQLSNFLSATRAGRQHPQFLVHGTATGRLSSSNPNVQNIPEELRKVYVPRDGYVFVEIDFSSLENRLTAWYANDTERLKRFEDRSFNEHRWMASQLFGVPYEKVPKDKSRESMYTRAKIVIHGSNYLMGARKIAWQYGLPEREVKDLLTKLYTRFPATKRWQEATVKRAQRGPLANAYGRMRWFWTSTLATEAVAFLPQSTGADVCFETMIRLMWNRTPMTEQRARQLWGDDIEPLPDDVYIVCQVHDSLLFEVPREKAEAVLARIIHVAEQPRKRLLGLVLPVEGKILNRWGE